MLKKIIHVFLFLLLIICLGCQEKQKNQEIGIVFRLVLQANPSNKVWLAGDMFRKEIEKRSESRIQVMFYDKGVLGAERQILEACYLGILEMVLITSSVVTTIDPVMSTLDMPYLFIDENHHQKILNGDIGRELLDNLTHVRFKGLAFYSCNFRHIFNSKRPIYSPDDLNGLKIRVMESPIMIESLNCMGASATPISASELYSSLKTGVVDGAENNAQLFNAAHLSDSCKFFSKTGHFANQMMLIANNSWFGSLPTEFQTMISETARDIIPEYNRRWNEVFRDAFSYMEKQDVNVNDITD
ncbi:TRAP transporter substrate-binding protein, partial [Candidatus Latescibacterota bacterium]